MLAEAIALSLRDRPQGSPGPSASGGANAWQGSSGTSAGTKRRAATDPVTAWCVTNRFAELEPALRALGVSDIEDLRLVTEEELQNMGLRGVACRRFFVKANQAAASFGSDAAELDAAIALSLQQAGGDAPQPRHGTSARPISLDSDDEPMGLPPAKSDSDIAREFHDAEVARDLAHRQHEERAAEASSFDCPVCMERMPVDGSFTGTCDHRVCGDCQYEHVVSKVEAGETSEAQLRCVLCPRALEPEQVLHTLATYGRSDLAQTFLDQRLASTTRGSGAFCSCWSLS